MLSVSPSVRRRPSVGSAPTLETLKRQRSIEVIFRSMEQDYDNYKSGLGDLYKKAIMRKASKAKMLGLNREQSRDLQCLLTEIEKKK